VTLSVSLLGTGTEPLVVVPVAGYPDTAVIHIGDQFHLHVRTVDIDRLSTALKHAREVLSGASVVSIKE
jgi:hypothetical protein